MVPRVGQNGKDGGGFPTPVRASIHPMRRAPGLVILFASLVCLGTGCVRQTRVKQVDLVGQLAPTGQLKSFDGHKVNLVEPGEPTLVVFLASWCAPSRVEASRLVDLATRFKPRGLRIVAVAIDEAEGPDAVRRFVEERHIPFDIVMGTPAVSRAYGGTPVTPTVFLIDRGGRIEGQIVGMREMTNLEPAVEKLMAGDQTASVASLPRSAAGR